MLLHTASLTHRPVYAQTLLHTALLHTNTFAHRYSAGPTKLAKNYQFFTLGPYFVRKGCRSHFKITLEPHFVPKGCCRTSQNPKKPSDFDTRTSFRAKTLPWTLQNRNFLPKFLTTEPHFVRKQCRGGVKSQFYLSLTIEPHFVQKGCRGGCKIAILLQFLTIESHFARNSCCGECKIAILLSF